jgi:hypothetical protein
VAGSTRPRSAHAPCRAIGFGLVPVCRRGGSSVFALGFAKCYFTRAAHLLAEAGSRGSWREKSRSPEWDPGLEVMSRGRPLACSSTPTEIILPEQTTCTLLIENGAEWLGYPTLQPLTLLECIVQSSSYSHARPAVDLHRHKPRCRAENESPIRELPCRQRTRKRRWASR